MPRYDFEVLDSAGKPTGETVEMTFRVSDRPDVVSLPDGRKARFSFLKTIQAVKAPSTSGYPKVCMSMTVFPDQVEEARRAYKHGEYRKDGTFVVRDRSEWKKALKERGRFDRGDFN